MKSYDTHNTHRLLVLMLVDHVFIYRSLNAITSSTIYTFVYIPTVLTIIW